MRIAFVLFMLLVAFLLTAGNHVRTRPKGPPPKVRVLHPGSEMPANRMPPGVDATRRRPCR